MNEVPLPIRSVLYVPASNEKALAKVISSGNALGADMVLFDLEDSVHPDNKKVARDELRKTLTANPPFPFMVRINSLNSAWGTEDLLAGIAMSPRAIVLPKVETSSDIGDALSAFEASDVSPDIGLWAMLETPLAIMNVTDIAAMATEQEGRLKALMLGTNDLSLESDVPIRPGRIAFVPWFMQCILAARANGLALIDGVFTDFRDAEGFSSECHQSAELGFDGKSLIHPSQVAECNRVFSPSLTEVEHALAIVAAFEDPANAGSAVLTVNGKMVEELHLRAARRLLAKSNT